MGLMTCPDCGREVSEFATACPSCGRPASRGFTQAEQKPEGATAAPKKTRNDRPTGSGWKAGLASAGVILLYLMVTRLPVYFQDPAAQDRDGSYFLMALDDFGDRLMADPEFRQFYEQLPDDTLSPDAWLSSSPAGPTFYLAQQGVALLPDDMLLRRHEIITELYSTDLPVCAQMVLRTANREQVLMAFASLDRQLIDEWFEISYEAVMAGLRAGPEESGEVSEVERQSAWEALRGSFTDDQWARIVDVEEGRITTESDVCWMGRALSRRMLEIGDSHRRVLIREVAANIP